MATLHRPAPRVLLIRMNGAVDGRTGAALADELAIQLDREGGGATFWDLEQMASYETDVRTACTNVLLDRLDRVTVCAYATSSLVRMGVSVANLVLGGKISTVKTRAEFETRLRQAVSESRRGLVRGA